MNEVGLFEKVSKQEFKEATLKMYEKEVLSTKINRIQFEKFEDMESEWFNTKAVEKLLSDLKKPFRATEDSAGYDFKAPFDITLQVGETLKIPSGIRVQIDRGWFLGALPKSGLGFGFRVQLDNTLGVIDGDYYFSDNEGHIMIKITNDGKEGLPIEIKKGEGFAQGIFLQYGITRDDKDTVKKDKRNGGMGSTGK